MRSLLLTGLCLLVSAATSLKAEVSEAGRLAGVIQSGAPAVEKEDACWRLKQIGNADSVPALATLLTDEHLYQAACDALETMPFAEAETALLAAIGKTTGEAKAGVIHALGERRNSLAVPALAVLLNEANSGTAEAATRALGKIGGPAAVAALRGSLRSAAPPLRAARVDALLHCATQLARSGDKAGARRIFEQFNRPQESGHVRAAAFAGLIRIAGDKSLGLAVEGIRGPDPLRQMVALQLARDLANPKATPAVTNLLRQAATAMQAALIGLLQQRDDATAAPAVSGLADSQDPYVRLTAIAALGTLGDETVVPFLARSATARDEAEQKAARVALIQLRRGAIGAAMVKELSVAPPDVQAELARALGARWEKSAVPALLEIARSRTETTRAAAIRALSLLADGSHLPALVKLLCDAANEAARADVRGVFESVVDRAEAKKVFDVTPIVETMGAVPPEVRVALLQVSALFADERLRGAFRAALNDAAPTLRAAAARALCDARDAELIPDLCALARGSEDATLRALALGGYVRLLREERSGFSAAKKLELLQAAYAFATRVEERKLVLSALGGVPLRGALELAEQALSQAEVKAEAEVAFNQIAKALLASDPMPAVNALRQLATSATNPETRANAQSILQQYDSGWLCAGPFRKQGKEGQALFDVVFPPERKDNPDVKWQRAPGSADLARAGEVVLDSVVGGDHCVIYLKTRVFVPSAQLVNLEIGSDDGIKLWANGEVVHANDAVRGLVPGQDKARATLREGWNDFRAKITQVTAGCGMILQFKAADGSVIPGLKLDPFGGTN